MKPKVEWKSLNELPEWDGCLVWVCNAKTKKVRGECTASRYNFDYWMKGGETHWAIFEYPDPPDEPTPFEQWWNKQSAAVVNERGFVSVATVTGKDNYPMSVGKSAAEVCFLAGRESANKENSK